MKDFELSITPVEAYNAPEIPMLINDNSALLKKLPSRWQKNVKVIACMGVIGSFTLAGCAPPIDLHPRLHGGGGAAPPPIYVVHLTEQEALGIIRARLEKAGLNFSSMLPEYTTDWSGVKFGLDLFDEHKKIAITYLYRHPPFISLGWDFVEQVEEAFRLQVSDIIVGAIFNPGDAQSDTFLREQLIAQVDMFVAYLQSEGILPLQQKISVMLNETPIEFDAFPVILNNQVMVPSPTIFEALGMEAEWDYSWEAVHAIKDSLSIKISPYTHSMFVNERWVRIDTPAVMRGNRILVPLQPIAEAVGANVEWDEDMKTIRINTN